MSAVLLVDDEPGVLFTLSELLTERGHRVIEARSGDDALRKVEEADAVLTDLSMPGMDGLELMTHIVQRDSTLPVIPVWCDGSVFHYTVATGVGSPVTYPPFCD
jgi:two-component system nitrogen regulation response regulator NtrX